MPWFPDFAAAAELARRDQRAEGRADPVGQYLTALSRGDSGDLEAVWPGEVVVADPRVGEVRGHRGLRRFVRNSEAWLAARHARVEWLAATCSADRAVVELAVHLVTDGRSLAWPVAVVAESPDDRSVAFRTYNSQRALDGRHHVRPPLLRSGPDEPGDVVARYRAALTAGDPDAVLATFAPDGYLQDPAGARHTGAEALRTFFAGWFDAGGGPAAQTCTTTDDGRRCAVETTYLRWGGHELPPQAGMAVFERAPDGLLAAVRLYDDVEPPAP